MFKLCKYLRRRTARRVYYPSVELPPVQLGQIERDNNRIAKGIGITDV